jgi:hypothetical protein
MSIPAIEELMHRALDVTMPTDVEIALDTKRNVLYIDIEGITILRINRPLVLRITKDGGPASLLRGFPSRPLGKCQAVYE